MGEPIKQRRARARRTIKRHRARARAKARAKARRTIKQRILRVRVLRKWMIAGIYLSNIVMEYGMYHWDGFGNFDPKNWFIGVVIYLGVLIYSCLCAWVIGGMDITTPQYDIDGSVMVFWLTIFISKLISAYINNTIEQVSLYAIVCELTYMWICILVGGNVFG